MTKKLTTRYVKAAIESFDDYDLLSEEYINNSSKLKILHSFCGNVFYPTWSNFNAGTRCPNCIDKKNKFDPTLPFEIVKKGIESVKGYQLLSEEYISAHSKLKILHSCGNIFWMRWHDFNNGSRCPIHRYESITGENNHNWNPNRTDEDREKSRYSQNKDRTEWIKAVYDRDNHTCQKCLVRGGSLHAHHILPWALFPELRFEIENGVTLCKTCHNRYHYIYGVGKDCDHETMNDHLYL